MLGESNRRVKDESKILCWVNKKKIMVSLLRQKVWEQQVEVGAGRENQSIFVHNRVENLLAILVDMRGRQLDVQYWNLGKKSSLKI
jgi:hypothetical protein